MTERTSLAVELEWAVSSRALDGAVCGDLHVVLPGSPKSLLCVMDGLGHGLDARRAAEEGARILRENCGTAPLLELVRRCHEGLRATRGVAMTLALLDVSLSALEWVSVGNVEGLVLRAGLPRGTTHAGVVLRGGVVGYRLPPLNASRVALEPGDLIVFATDGIRGGFNQGLDLSGQLQELADGILHRFAKATDDTLVLLVRFGGGKLR